MAAFRAKTDNTTGFSLSNSLTLTSREAKRFKKAAVKIDEKKNWVKFTKQQ